MLQKIMTALGLALAGIIGSVALLGVIVLLLSVPVLILWNWVIPGIFGLATINYWQAFGLLLLASILLRGIAPLKFNEEKKKGGCPDKQK